MTGHNYGLQGGPQKYHAEWKKPVTKAHILCNSILWNMQKRQITDAESTKLYYFVKMVDFFVLWITLISKYMGGRNFVEEFEF